MTVPSVGRVVHYVSFGTPGGEYTSKCRAAIVTQVHGNLVDPAPEGEAGVWLVGLAVLNPSGLFFDENVRQSQTEHRGGTWHWPERIDDPSSVMPAGTRPRGVVSFHENGVTVAGDTEPEPMRGFLIDQPNACPCHDTAGNSVLPDAGEGDG